MPSFRKNYMHFNVKLQKARVQNANQIAQNGDLNAKNW